jgi:hypothetical protein
MGAPVYVGDSWVPSMGVIAGANAYCAFGEIAERLVKAQPLSLLMALPLNQILPLSRLPETCRLDLIRASPE